MELKGLNILSVFQDEHLFNEVRDMFLGLHYNFSNYNSLLSAVKQFDWKTPDIVMIEVTSNGDEVYDFLGKVRNMPKPMGDTPFIFITSVITTFDREKIFTFGNVDYVIKPFTRAEISAKIENLLKSQLVDSAYRKKSDVFDEIIALKTSKFYEILNMSVLLNSERDLDRLLQTAVSKVTKIMDAHRTTLFIYDKEKDELWSKVAEGLETFTINLPRGKGIAWKVFEKGTPLLVPDVQNNPDFDASWDRKIGFNTRSMLCYPVKNRDGEIKGVLQVLNAEVDKFQASDMALAEACASQIGVALENYEICSKNLRS